MHRNTRRPVCNASGAKPIAGKSIRESSSPRSFLYTNDFPSSIERQSVAAARFASSTAFGRTFIVSMIAFTVAFFTLRIEGVIHQGVVVAALLLSPVFAAVCGAGSAWLTERHLDKRHRRELEEAQRQRQEMNLKLLVLQAQLEPHFLFNTLASLRALLREDVDQAEELVDALVSHLRAVLPTMRNDVGVSTLTDQLAICASYLELMSIRLDGRLSYEIDVPKTLESALIPPLMLLTLVENAIKHGIEPKSGKGRIAVQARRAAAAACDHLVVSVTDDGIGPSAATQPGLGLQNLREQLRLRYGADASLSLERTAMSGGTVASLLIPYERLQAT